jgi:hypothetical protein
VSDPKDPKFLGLPDMDSDPLLFVPKRKKENNLDFPSIVISL